MADDRQELEGAQDFAKGRYSLLSKYYYFANFDFDVDNVVETLIVVSPSLVLSLHDLEKLLDGVDTEIRREKALLVKMRLVGSTGKIDNLERKKQELMEQISLIGGSFVPLLIPSNHFLIIEGPIGDWSNSASAPEM